MSDASMGPRLISRGDHANRGRPEARLQASMGPRLISRGDGTRIVRLGEMWCASMGPRLISRGDTVSVRAVRRAAVLQWGRG